MPHPNARPAMTATHLKVRRFHARSCATATAVARTVAKAIASASPSFQYQNTRSRCPCPATSLQTAYTTGSAIRNSIV